METTLRPARAHALARWVRQVAFHTPVILAGLAVLAIDWKNHDLGVDVAIAWFAVSRITYMSYAALVLRRAPKPEDGLPREVREAAWHRFSRRVSWLMDNDAVSIGALAIVTRGSFDVGIPWPVAIASGVGLCVVGIAVKTWAGAHLPAGSYHWRDFFVPEDVKFSGSGPYRFFHNPMYTLGYAHAYGFALAWLSFPCLLAAAFAQATILAVNAFIEQPHFRRHTAG